jgi:hypothetical protein
VELYAPKLSEVSHFGVTLCNLGWLLEIRFGKIGDSNDLEEAIRLMKLMVQTMPDNHLNRGANLQILGSLLFQRFERTKETKNLEEATQMTELAVQAMPDDHRDRAACLNNLALLLRRKFERTGRMEGLDEGVQRAKSNTYDRGMGMLEEGKHPEPVAPISVSSPRLSPKYINLYCPSKSYNFYQDRGNRD